MWRWYAPRLDSPAPGPEEQSSSQDNRPWGAKLPAINVAAAYHHVAVLAQLPAIAVTVLGQLPAITVAVLGQLPADIVAVIGQLPAIIVAVLGK